MLQEIPYFTILGYIATGVGIIFSIGLLVLFRRVKGVISWNRSLKQELKKIEKEKQNYKPEDAQAYEILLSKCNAVFRSTGPELSEISNIPDYVRSISRCYNPDSDKPELQITVGQFIISLEKSLVRFDKILSRKGFRRVSSISVSEIKKTYARYKKLSDSKTVQWYLKHKKKLSSVSFMRFIIFPEPVSILIYLTNKLTLLLLIKYLLIDIYLYTGQLAIEAYSGNDIQGFAEDEEELKETVKDLGSLSEHKIDYDDPELNKIKNSLTGFTAMLYKSPDFNKLKSSLMSISEIISAKYFPDSDCPVEEASIGPLLTRTRSWIDTFGKGNNYPLTNRLYRIRISTLVSAKNLSDSIVPSPLKNALKKLQKTYGWIKWPFFAYRLTKKTPLRVSLDVGWIISRKAALAYIYSRIFDRCVAELDNVYSESLNLRGKARHIDN